VCQGTCRCAKKVINLLLTNLLGTPTTILSQGDIVDASVNNFVINVAAALVIVIFSLLIFMGWHSAAVMSFILLITVGATLTTMQIINIPIHRISLGALIISLGMMVDNAVVVMEAILVGVQQGKKKLDIAMEIVSQTMWPLLAGTMVGVIVFAPMGRYPKAAVEIPKVLPRLPLQPPAGIPSKVLERRPDIVSVERKVAQAFNNTAQAKAARLPQFSITSTVSGSSSSLSDALNPANAAWQLGSNLLAPHF